MSLASERDMPVIEITRRDGWYLLPAPYAAAWLPDEDSALAAARRIWPGTAFRIVDIPETELRALYGDR